MSTYKIPLRILFCFILIIPVSIAVEAEPITSILERAIELVGSPYRNGGTDPSGFDCSGFIMYLYRDAIPELPRISRQMANLGDMIYPDEWYPGDLLFYATGVNPNRINHVAIWLGEGHIIHSLSDGPETGVVITPASSSYWQKHYITAKRILDTDGFNTSPPSMDTYNTNTPSVWDDFNGYLRGDFEAWKAAEEAAFEDWKNNN